MATKNSTTPDTTSCHICLSQIFVGINGVCPKCYFLTTQLTDDDDMTFYMKAIKTKLMECIYTGADVHLMLLHGAHHSQLYSLHSETFSRSIPKELHLVSFLRWKIFFFLTWEDNTLLNSNIPKLATLLPEIMVASVGLYTIDVEDTSA